MNQLVSDGQHRTILQRVRELRLEGIDTTAARRTDHQRWIAMVADMHTWAKESRR